MPSTKKPAVFRAVRAVIAVAVIAALAWWLFTRKQEKAEEKPEEKQPTTPQEKHEALLVEKMKRYFSGSTIDFQNALSFCDLAGEYRKLYGPVTHMKVEDLLKRTGDSHGDLKRRLYNGWRTIKGGDDDQCVRELT